MATFSGEQVYVSTTRYERSSAAAVGVIDNTTLYTVPSSREARVEILFMRCVSVSGNCFFEIVHSPPGLRLQLLRAAVGTTQFGYASVFTAGHMLGNSGETGSTSTRQEPFNFILKAGEAIQFNTLAGSTSDQYQYSFSVKEYQTS